MQVHLYSVINVAKNLVAWIFADKWRYCTKIIHNNAIIVDWASINQINQSNR